MLEEAQKAFSYFKQVHQEWLTARDECVRLGVKMKTYNTSAQLYMIPLQAEYVVPETRVPLI